MTDPLEKALDELIEAVVRSTAGIGLHWWQPTIDDHKRLILDCAMWIGDDDDCECLPDGPRCSYCQNKYKQQKARKENVSDTR